jgi:hypothetical protein
VVLTHNREKQRKSYTKIELGTEKEKNVEKETEKKQ